MQKALQMIKLLPAFILLCFFTNPTCAQNQPLIDSLVGVLKFHSDDTAQVNTLNALANEFRNYNPDTSIYYGNCALRLSTKLNYKQGIADAYLQLGSVKTDMGSFDEALKDNKSALKEYDQLLNIEDIPDKAHILLKKALTYNNIGIIHFYQGKYAEAIKTHFYVLKIYEELGDKKGKAASLTNIGNVYSKQGNYAEALKNHLAALTIHEAIRDKRRIAISYVNIGIVYRNQNNNENALKNYFAALKLFEELSYKRGTASALSSIGSIYDEQSNYHEALKYYLACLKIREELGDKEGIAFSCLNIGNIYRNQNKNNEARLYLNKGLLLANNIKNLKNVEYAYVSLSKLDSAQGNFKNAFENYKLYITFRDSLKNNEITQKIMQQQMQYDFEKKEAIAKAEQQIKDEVIQEQLQQQKIIRNSSIAGSILLILLIVVLINRNKLKRTVEMERMRSRLSRDLHDDIGSTLSSINILSRTAQNNLNTSQDEKTKASLEKINERSQRLLDNMSDIIWNINPGNDTIEEVMSRMREYATTILEAKNIGYLFDFPNEKMDCKLSMHVKNNLYLIFKEAVNNLSKYSGCSMALLSLTFDEKNIHLKIEDNGKGFNEAEITHRGGLSNMNHRAGEIKGTLTINSVISKGTQVELTLPRYC